MSRCTRIIFALLTCFALNACALFTKHTPAQPRYFTAQDDELAGEKAAKAEPLSNLSVRLGRVTSASYLRERIVYRTKARELRYYESRRWSERPDALLKAALARCLFEEHGLTMVISGAAPTLDVQLTAFEEIVDAPHRVRAEATIVLHDGALVRLHETLRVEEPVPSARDEDAAPEALIQAFATALRKLVEKATAHSIAVLTLLAQAPLNTEDTSP